MSKFLLPALAVLSFSVCLAQTPSKNVSPSETGIEGTIILSPSRPGPIREGVPSTRPLANVKFIVQKQGESAAAASFTTDDQGHFRVSLPAGHYTVTREGGKSGVGRFGPFEVEVSAGKMATVQWTCDSGMR